MKSAVKIGWVLCIVLSFSAPSWSDQLQDSVYEIQQDSVYEIQQGWAKLNYSSEPNKEVVEGLSLLADQANRLADENPENTELQIWSAIVLSTLANKKGGLGALGLVKQAKAKLEIALEQDPIALNGSAYASLGVLYHKVPSWPLGFGNDGLARKNLEAAINIDPNGLDTNFFYADFLADAKDYKGAIEHVQLSLSAPTLENRPVADAGRRREAQALLAELRKHI